MLFYFFFFNDTATTEIYTLSLHDALPIFEVRRMIAIVKDRLRGGDHESVGRRVVAGVLVSGKVREVRGRNVEADPVSRLEDTSGISQVDFVFVRVPGLDERRRQLRSP